MRIAFVTQWFPPERGSVIPESIAVGLAALGHDVHVLTAFPNYPTGRLYPGWRQRPYASEPHSPGVTVHRTPVYTSHDSHPVRRMANYLSHAATATLLGSIRLPRPDVWLVYSSPATAALPAQLAPLGKRAPICLLIQDLWPDSVTGSGMLEGRLSRLVERALSAYARFSYRHAARIGVISPGVVEILEERGVDPKKIGWTPNWLKESNGEVLEGANQRAIGPQGGRRRFLYAGNLGTMQALDELIEAFSMVPEVDLVLMGDGVERETISQKADGLSNVTVLPQVGHEEAEAYLAAADILVVSLNDSPLLRVTMPSKVQACLRAGKPILAHAAGDVAALIDGNGIGATSRPGNTTETVGAIRRLALSSDNELAHMGAIAHRTYTSLFSPEIGVSRLESLLIQAQEESHL